MIPAAILSVIDYIINHPDVATKGVSWAVNLVQSAIAAWQRSGSPAEPTDALLAEWNASGIDYAAIKAEAESRGM